MVTSRLHAYMRIITKGQRASWRLIPNVILYDWKLRLCYLSHSYWSRMFNFFILFLTLFGSVSDHYFRLMIKNACIYYR